MPPAPYVHPPNGHTHQSAIRAPHAVKEEENELICDAKPLALVALLSDQGIQVPCCHKIKGALEKKGHAKPACWWETCVKAPLTEEHEAPGSHPLQHPTSLRFSSEPLHRAQTR